MVDQVMVLRSGLRSSCLCFLNLLGEQHPKKKNPELKNHSSKNDEDIHLEVRMEVEKREPLGNFVIIFVREYPLKFIKI